MHTITDQIKLLMVQKKSPKRRNEGKNWGKKIEYGKKKQMREKLFLGKIKSPTLSHLLTVT